MNLWEAVDPIGVNDAIKKSFASVFGELHDLSETLFQKTKEAVCSSYGLATPCTVRRTSLFYTFRGVDMWGSGSFITDGISYPNNTDPGYIPCKWENLNE